MLEFWAGLAAMGIASILALMVWSNAYAHRDIAVDPRSSLVAFLVVWVIFASFCVGIGESAVQLFRLFAASPCVGV